MKKLLVVFTATSYSRDLAGFAFDLAKQSNSVIHTVYLTPSFVPVMQYPFSNDLPLASTGLVSTPEMIEENQKLAKANMELWQEECAENGVVCKANDSPSVTIEDLIDQSAFTDLILCDSKNDLGGVSIRDLLVDTHCPVLLVPEKVTAPRRAVLCYDESFSSILAMKMYSYVFPEWKYLPTTVVSISPKGDNGTRHEDYLEGWLPEHFSNFRQEVLQGNLQRELVSYIGKSAEPSVVVMGAYGGNAVSRLFHQSLANIVIEETNATLFIMHE